MDATPAPAIYYAVPADADRSAIVRGAEVRYYGPAMSAASSSTENAAQKVARGSGRLLGALLATQAAFGGALTCVAILAWTGTLVREVAASATLLAAFNLGWSAYFASRRSSRA